MLNNLKKENIGITLIEVLVYVSLLALASVIIISFVITLITTQNKIGLERETWENAQFALDRISRDIQKASSIDEGGSIFESNPGKLNLNVYMDSDDIDTTVVSYYVSGDRLYVKIGDGIAEPLTSEDVKVTNFYLNNHVSATANPLIQVDIEVEKKQGASEEFSAEASASISATLRNF